MCSPTNQMKILNNPIKLKSKCISCHKRKKQRYSDYCKSCYEEGYEIVKHEESKQ